MNSFIKSNNNSPIVDKHHHQGIKNKEIFTRQQIEHYLCYTHVMGSTPCCSNSFTSSNHLSNFTNSSGFDSHFSNICIDSILHFWQVHGFDSHFKNSFILGSIPILKHLYGFALNFQHVLRFDSHSWTLVWFRLTLFNSYVWF